MQIYIFTRFQAQPGKVAAFEEALREVVPASRKEEGCLNIHAFRSIRDPHVFYIHSRWRDEAAFNAHANLPHTLRFIERAEPLLEHEILAQRCELIT
jgi:quinol monooxygenase YgiN